MDIAELGLAVRSDGVVVAHDRLRKFEGAAGAAERQAKGLAQATRLLTGALTVLAGALGLQQLIRITSLWTDLNSRVRNAIGPHESAADVMSRIDQMARRTYSSLEQTAESWLRNNTALRQLGYTTSQQLDLTETLNNALVVSATKGDRAQSVMNAWSKAMALGKLSGDNLNTIMESGGRLSEALADSMGVTVLELRALGAAGKITSKDMFGVTSQLEKLREEADAMPATIQDGVTLLSNSLLSTIGRLDEFTGVSSAVAGAIIAVADNMDLLVPIVGALAGVVATALLPAVWGAVSAFAALALTPIGLIAIAVGVLAGAITYLWNEQRKGEQAARDHATAITTNANAIEVARTASQGFRTDLRNQIAMQVEAARAALTEADAQTVAARAKAASSRVDILGFTIGNVFDESAADAALAKSLALDSALQQLETQLATIDDIMKTKPGADSPSVHLLTEDQIKALENAKKAYSEITVGARQYIETQQMEASALGMTAEAASRLRHEQELLHKAANDNIALSPAQRQELGNLAGAMAAAEERTRRLTEVYDFGKSSINSFFSDLKTNLMNGASLWDGFANAGADALNRIADKALSMAADGIWDMIFGAVMGGITGGIGGGTWGKFGGFSGYSGMFGLPSMDGGGFTGSGSRTGGVDGIGGFPAILHPNETVIDHTKGAANSNAPSIAIGSVIVNANSEAEGAAAARGFAQELRRHFPAAMKDYQRNPYRQAS